MKGTSKFTKIIDVTFIINKTASIDKSTSPSLISSHEIRDELVFVIIEVKIGPKWGRVNTHRNTNGLPDVKITDDEICSGDEMFY